MDSIENKKISWADIRSINWVTIFSESNIKDIANAELSNKLGLDQAKLQLIDWDEIVQKTNVHQIIFQRINGVMNKK